MAHAAANGYQPPSTNWMELHGERLLDNGYPIIPIIPHDKKPGKFSGGMWMPLVDWTNFGDRVAKEFHVRSIWSRWPGCGVGIVCGRVAAVDLDVLEGALSLKLQDLAFEMLGQTPAVRIGMAPKRLLVYRTKAPFAKLKAAPIEILCQGQQFVAYGMHPKTGSPYQWPIEHLADLHINDLPLIDQDKAQSFVAQAERFIPPELRISRLEPDMHDEQSRVSYGDLSGTEEAVASALDYIVNADLHYDDWIKIGMSIKGALGEQGRHLWLAWSATSNKDQPAASAKAWASFRPASIGAGTIYWLAEGNGWRPGLQPRLVLNGTAAEAQSVVNGAEVAAALVRPQIVAEKTAAHLPLVVEHDGGEEQASFDPLDVEGVLKDMVEWIVSTAIKPQPELALAASLVAVGAAMGRRYATCTNLRPNLYALSLAYSGSGKDHPLKCVTEAFSAAGIAHYLAGNRIASGQGLLTSLYKHPVRLVQMDEFGHFLKGLSQKHAPKHIDEIVSNMLELYSKANSFMLGTEYANQDEKEQGRAGANGSARKDICQPHLGFYGTTAPSTFWSALQGGAMRGGFMARFIFFEAPEVYPRSRRLAATQPPASVVDGLRLIASGPLMTAMMAPQIMVLPETPEAASLLERLISDQDDWLNNSPKDEAIRSIISRWVENATKCAMVRAVSAAPDNPVIRVADVVWGRELVRRSILKLLARADDMIADDEYHARYNVIRKLIKDAGQAGITASQLCRSCRSIRPRDRHDVLASLEESGVIAVLKTATLGNPKPTIRYQYLG